MSFFATLFNKNKTSLLKQDRDLQIDDPLQDFADDDIEDESLKIKSLFQILYNHVTRGRKKTPLQLINAHAIYERCKSRELITAFNKQSCCVSYKYMKQHRMDLAKYTIIKGSDGVPLPSHFLTASFTIAAFDNFDHHGKNSLSGAEHAHDTASILCQEMPPKIMPKPNKSSVDLKCVNIIHKLACSSVSKSAISRIIHSR